MQDTNPAAGRPLNLASTARVAMRPIHPTPGHEDRVGMGLSSQFSETFGRLPRATLTHDARYGPLHKRTNPRERGAEESGSL